MENIDQKTLFVAFTPGQAADLAEGRGVFPQVVLFAGGTFTNWVFARVFTFSWPFACPFGCSVASR